MKMINRKLLNIFVAGLLALSLISSLSISRPSDDLPVPQTVFNSVYQIPEYPFGHEWDTGDGNQTYNVGWGGDVITVYADVALDPAAKLYVKYDYCNHMACYDGEPGGWDDMDFRNSTFVLGWEMNYIGGTLYSYTLIGDWMLGYPTYPASTYNGIHVGYTVYAKNTTNGNVTVGEPYYDMYPYWPTSSINVTAGVSGPPVYPCRTVWVNGSANYYHRLNWHDQPPANLCDVTVSVNPVYPGKTDANGDFSVQFPAPMTPGIYTINTTVSNSTVNRNATSVSNDIQIEVLQPIVNISLYLNTSTTLPKSPILVNGTVNLDDSSIPVGSEVNVSIKETGSFWLVTVTNNGSYEVEITSPNATGNFNVNVTNYNSTYDVTGWNETPFTVVATPLPDLVVTNTDISIEGTLIEGFEYYTNITVHNLGLALAYNVLVSTTRNLDDLYEVTDERVNLSVGESVILHQERLAQPGENNLSVVIDGYKEIQESSEDNNHVWKQFTVLEDYDGDGTPDIDDEDNDNDNYTDEIEVAEGSNPRDNSSIPADIDGDFIPDSQDNDKDGDGVDNDDDSFPEDPDEWADFDDDGIGDNADPDDDNDGIPDDDDPYPRDTDNDGLPNNVDLDDDADGIPDAQDTYPLDTDNDGEHNGVDADDDGDGVDDPEDQFPLDPDESLDTDGDGIGDNADPDDDNDGVPDNEDKDPLDPEVGRGGFNSIYLMVPILVIGLIGGIVLFSKFRSGQVPKVEEPEMETEVCPSCGFDVEPGAACPFCAMDEPEPPPEPKPENEEILARIEQAYKEGKMNEETYLKNIEKFN